MKYSIRLNFKIVSLVGAFVLMLVLTMLFQLPGMAQYNPQIIPRIETITGNPKNFPPSYRLTISRPQDIVFVSCPSNHAPKLGYLRNAEAIQCEPT
ncbi:MAG: hypothetical protein KME43_23375 [Myxacorys chilensis ATA2-1-KO14]|jgi:hypothetical protein|nr:hypothetical protein [Myxacorys chilensis ATA2-1-KO14]